MWARTTSVSVIYAAEAVGVYLIEFVKKLV